MGVDSYFCKRNIAGKPISTIRSTYLGLAFRSGEGLFCCSLEKSFSNTLLVVESLANVRICKLLAF